MIYNTTQSSSSFFIKKIHAKSCKSAMDMQQEELQFLGFFGLFKETYKLIFTLRRIFAQITFSLILPLTLIFLAHEKVSEILFTRMWTDEFLLGDAPSGTAEFRNLSHLVRSDRARYLLVKLAYFTFVLAFSLLSTSAVVYAIACAYTARPITFRNVIGVVPRVWKRLILTFLCAFLAFSLYNVALALALYAKEAAVADYSPAGDAALLVIILVLYAVGFVYLTVIWQLASVVSVLEECYGIRAMIKSRDLIKGKMCVAVLMFLKLNFVFFALYFGFRVYIGYGESMGVGEMVGLGALILVLFLKMILFGLVVQTVIYFVCKSYHHENIDKSALSYHLEVYLGDYVPLKAKDVQMEEVHV